MTHSRGPGRLAFPIEKGVPPPTRLKYNRYPWKNMEIGDSFLIPLGQKNKLPGLYTSAKNAGIVITVKRTPQGHRVWRIG